MGFWSIIGEQRNRLTAGAASGSGRQKRETLALPRPHFGYACAVVLAVLAQICRMPLHPQTAIPFITYVPFIVFAGWYCGFGPGLLTTSLCTLECLYLAIDPVNSIAVAEWQDWIGLAILLATGVVSSLLFDSLRKARRSDAVARSQTEFLRRHLAAVIDSSDDAIISTDRNGVIVSWNRSAETMFGYSADEAIGQHITFFMDPRIANGELAIQARIRNGESVDHYETERRRKDGTKIFISVTASPVKDASGQIVGASKISRDISERKKQEEIRERQAEELKIYSTLLENIVEHSPAAITVLGGPEFTFELVNPAYQAFQPGVTMNGKTVAEVWPDAAPIVLPLLRSVRDTRKPYYATAMPIPRRRGLDAPVEERFFTFSYVPLVGLNGGSEPKILVVALEVTDMKRTELSLRESEERFRGLTAATSEVLYRMSPDWSEMRALKGNGFIADTVGPDSNWLPKYIHPEDQPRVMEAIHRAIATRSTFELEHRVLCAHGVRGWVSSRAIPVLGADGEILEWFGAASDITERKRAEEALRESEMELKAAEAMQAERQRFLDVLDALPPMVCLLTPDHHVAWSNRAFCERFGAPQGRPCFEFCFGKTEPCDFCESYKALETGEPHRWEVHGPDGSVIDAHDFPFTDVDGTPMILEMGIDVTEQRRSEAELAQYRQHLEELVRERTGQFETANAQLQTEIVEREHAMEALRESEGRVRRTLDSVLSPEGDIASLELSDILDPEAVQSLLKDFYQLAHIPVAVLDVKGKVLAGAGWQKICTEFHRLHPETARNCLESDTELTAGVPEGEFRLYKCKNNLWDISTPIMVSDRHIGNVFSGQFFFDDEQADRQLFLNQAKQYGFPQQEYLAALDAVPRFSREAIRTGMDFFVRLANLISRMGFSNIKLARSLAEGERTTDELRNSEEKLRLLSADLERRVQNRTRELTATNKELESFTYSVSHDLRAPLRGIDGWSAALLEDYGDKLDEQAREYLDRVRTETQRMGQLIDDLLRLSRVTRAEMKPTQVDLSAMAGSITTRIREANPERNTEFSIQPGLTAEGDPRLLDIALTNLLDNAAKFSSKRADAKVEFGTVDQRTSCGWQSQFFVRDNGAGFDMAYASQLFGAFQRLHSASEFPGTGIGLATVQRVILRHGGSICAESKPDQGATFYFTIGGAN